jgi:hypothetical protein
VFVFCFDIFRKNWQCLCIHYATIN